MKSEVPSGYFIMETSQLPSYLHQHVPKDVLPDGLPSSWDVKEVGDGNLNLVFIVNGQKRAVVVKQALPYVRAAGEGWPMSIKRAYFECSALEIEGRYVPSLVPKMHFYDPDCALFVMDYLSPHTILRQGIIAGCYYPQLANDVGEFLANTLFFTSDFGMPSEEKKQLVAQFALNADLCRITEDLIFTEPYYNAPRNHWNSPLLDDVVHTMWKDSQLIEIAMQYKWKFMTEAQALLHGDLHTGSIMVTKNSTKIIDPEFAFYGPMAFDIGNYMGNLFMAYFSQPAHRRDQVECQAYQAWLLQQCIKTWECFHERFTYLWDEKRNSVSTNQGLAWPVEIYPLTSDGDNRHVLAKQQFFRQLFTDMLVNAGLEMNRRIVGFAGVADLKTITPLELRAKCEQKSLLLAYRLMIAATEMKSMQDVVELAEQLEKQ